MVRRGISGGMLSVVSLLKEQDRKALVENSMVKTSSSIKQAAKIGLQSLYANADEVLDKYKDFDIIKEMKARKGANLLWVRARAIDADIVNTNGDYFSEEELTKEVDYQGKKMPAYKTFEGVPIYTNHKNDNIEEAKGMVVYAEWDDEEKCVYCVFFIDEDAYPDIGRGIRQAYVHDVSMGCFPKGTLVLTESGYKPIEQVELSDRLIDVEGNLTNIINRQLKIETEKIYNIKFEGGYSFSCTKEHPILAVKQDLWKSRIKRDTNSKLQRKYNSVIPDFVEAQNLEVGDLLAVKMGGEVKECDLTISQAKLLGLFAAEGNFLKYKNEIKEVEFTFALDEKESLVYECVNLFKEIFDIEARIYERIPKNTIAVRVYSPEIANWFKYHIGEYSYGKTISNELRFANLDIQKAFVCNWIKGDGCITHKSLPSNGISATTCSFELAKDITYILTRLGLYHKIYAKYEGKGYSFSDAIKIYSGAKGFDGRKMSFNIELPSYEASKIAKECDFICNTSKVLQSQKNYTDGYIVRKIKSIEVEPFNGPVYNFETESHTYTVSNIGVHNCSVDLGRCSICGNEATTEKDYCDCLKKYKGKMHPSGKKAFEYNYGIKFIELSCVGDGAFESCEIVELYDQDELLQKAQDTIKTAQSLNSSITLAASINENINDKRDVEQALRQLQNLNQSIIKIAQTAGTLVGGQLLGGAGSQNATVVKILQGLGIDPSSSLNILDLVNLALNFLEVAVLNLFSRKDNIDLTHVAKLTKAMGELQNTLQDMIDDGIETSGQKNTQPMIPPQAPAQPPQALQPPQTQSVAPTMNASLEQPMVGTMVAPFSQTPYAMPLGGGVSASGNNLRFVWASTHESEEIETKEIKLNKIGRLAVALDNLREACLIPKKNDYEVINNLPQKNKTSASSGDKNIMDQFKKIAQDYKKQNSVALAIDIKLDDKSGNRVVLSTDKGIKGYHQGALTNWSPNLTDSQLAQMENGDGYRVAADLLTDFSKVVKTAMQENKVDVLMVFNENLDQDKDQEFARAATDIESEHRGDKLVQYEEKLKNHRKNDDHLSTLDEKLSTKRTSDLVRIVTELSADAKKGLGREPLEDMLHPNFAKSTVPGREIMSNVVKGIARACQATNSNPEEVVEFLTKLSSNEMGRLLKIARLGTHARRYSSIMGKYAQTDLQMQDEMPMGVPGEDMPEADMETEAIKNVADTATPETSEGDIMKALEVIKDNFSQAVEKLNEILGKTKEDDKGDEMKDALVSDDVDQDAMKGAVTGLSLSGEETGASPSDLVDSVNSMPAGDMAAGISEARTPMATSARAKQKTIKTASKNNLNNNIVGWLADMANHHNVSSEKMALAAKLFCSYDEAATTVLAKAIRTSDVQVIDETTHATTITCTLDDIGTDVKDAAFNQKFRDFAVNLLSQSGYEVDPATFALTEIIVSEDGTVQGKVSTKATKYFNPEAAMESGSGLDYVDVDKLEKAVMPEGAMVGEVVSDVPAPAAPESMSQMIMSASAKTAKRLARMQNIMRLAQLGFPGGSAAPAPAPGAGAAPTDPTGGLGAGMAGGAADLGLGSLTGASEPAPSDTPINDSPEPGNKAPWGTICPQCGSKDVDIANGEGSCNSCNAQLKYKFTVEVAPPDEKNQEAMPETESMSAPMPPVGGPATAPDAGLGGMPPMAPAPGALASNYKLMTRIAYKTSADVYASALSDNFNKVAASKLPVGMICPACGSRTASKQSKNTYCYDCGTMSISNVKRLKDEPGMIEANIFWIN